jgi:hypothetical protein
MQTESLFHCGDEKIRGGVRRNVYMLYTDDAVMDVQCSTQQPVASRWPSNDGPVGDLWPRLRSEQQRRLCGVSMAAGRL